MDAVMIVAVLGFAALCGAVSFKIAAGKGRNTMLWALVGVVLNLLGLLVVLVVPRAGGGYGPVQSDRVKPGESGKPARSARAAIA